MHYLSFIEIAGKAMVLGSVAAQFFFVAPLMDEAKQKERLAATIKNAQQNQLAIFQQTETKLDLKQLLINQKQIFRHLKGSEKNLEAADYLRDAKEYEEMSEKIDANRERGDEIKKLLKLGLVTGSEINNTKYLTDSLSLMAFIIFALGSILTLGCEFIRLRKDEAAPVVQISS